MIHYILQVVVFQLLFLWVYDAFLKKETFFQYNRLYLLATTMLSFLLPFIKIEAIQQQIPAQYIVQLPSIWLGTTQAQQPTAEMLETLTISNTTSVLNSFTLGMLVWGLGAFIALVLFLYKYLKIKRFLQKGKREMVAGYHVIILPETTTAFSFFKMIFIGDQLSPKQKQHILLHEKVHVAQGHTFDLLFFELLKIICWFNPLSYVFQKRITDLHEFIADRNVAISQGDATYYNTLLNQVFKTENISFINTFFNPSFIKKRIIMLQKSKSNRSQLVKYLTIVPLVFGMLFYTSCVNETVEEQINADSTSETEVMKKINELEDAIKQQGNLTDDEVRALRIITSNANQGDKTYTIREEYLLEDGAVEVPFAVIDKVPTYPGCSGDNATLKNCMSEQIQQLVMKNFNTKLADDFDLSGKQRIRVQFKIDVLGSIVDIKARGPHPALEEEAIRVVSLMPQMTPGEQAGKPAGVLYSLPIVFNIEE